MWKLVFLGTPRSDSSSHAHEGGPELWAPLAVLAVLAVLGGYTTHAGTGLVYGHAFAGVWSGIPHAEGASPLVMSVLILAVGAGVALAFYQHGPRDTLAVKAPVIFGILSALKESFDWVYDYYVVKIQQRFAMLLNMLEQILLAGMIVRGLAGIVGLFGLGARALHVGRISTYVYWFLGGVVVLWLFVTGVL